MYIIILYEIKIGKNKSCEINLDMWILVIL